MPEQGASSRVSDIGFRSTNSSIVRNPNTVSINGDTASQEQINTVRAQLNTAITSISTPTTSSSFDTRVRASTANSLSYLDDIPAPTVAATNPSLPDYDPGTKRNRSERKAYVEEHMHLWDVDGDGVVGHKTDGELIKKFTHGQRGDKLTKYISKDSKLSTTQVEAKLQRLLDGGALDIDNDGKNEAHDGTLIDYWINRFD